MKQCPECRRIYTDETLNYCLDDGTWLIDSGRGDGPDTAIMSPTASTGGQGEDNTRRYATGDLISREIKRHKFGAVFAFGIGAVILAGFAYGVYRFFDSRKVSEPERANINITTQRLTGDGKARGAEISPDGKFLAYIRTEGGERSLWLKQIQSNSNIPIVKPGEMDRFDGIAFSPDGNFVYFNAQSKTKDVPSVYRASILGGTPTKAFINANQVQISPDGKQACFARFDFAANESAIIVANVDGTNERKIAARTGNQFFEGTPAWSPDGKTIAVAAGDDSVVPDPNMWITLVSVADGTLADLGSSKFAGVEDLVWHPSGDSLIVVALEGIEQPQLWEISYPSGTKRRLTNNLNGHYSVSITADGKAIVTGEIYSRSAVWVSPDLKPENAKPVMPSTGDTWGFGWTPDGRIVYVSDQTGDAEVWIMNADGSNAKPLTSDRIFKTTPVVSHDGQYIVYTSSAGGGQLIRIDINGGNPLVLDKIPGADNPDISIDSKWVIFSAYFNGVLKIMRVPIDGGEALPLTDYRATEPRYSRDGTRFACFIPNEKTQNWTRLAIVPAEGGSPIKIFDTPPNVNIGRGPIWTPDDRGITLVVAPGELQNLWLQPVDGGDAKPMTKFDVPGVARREYSRDGKRIAIVRAEGIGNAIMITGYR